MAQRFHFCPSGEDWAKREILRLDRGRIRAGYIRKILEHRKPARGLAGSRCDFVGREMADQPASACTGG